MITEGANKDHRKHAKLTRASGGEWARNELAILGAPCKIINELADMITAALAGKWKVAYADADHAQQGVEASKPAAEMHYQDQVSSHRITLKKDFSAFEKRGLFNTQDLVLVNGNHFQAQQQIVIIDEAKPLDKKLDKLTDVVLILLRERGVGLPDYLNFLDGVPLLQLADSTSILRFIRQYLDSRVAPLNGLVLAGGKSLRMGQDKGLLQYHGIMQREYVYKMMQPDCRDVFLSCNAGQMNDLPAGLNAIQDRFLDLGPMGGLLSAMQLAPDNAWLAVACDLPFLNEKTLQYLIDHRNPAKYATSFLNEEQGFPEPMLTIWEPRSYPLLLQFLGMGYSCPRKVLINSDIELLKVPDGLALQNINDPEGYREAYKQLNADL